MNNFFNSEVLFGIFLNAKRGTPKYVEVCTDLPLFPVHLFEGT